MKIYGPYFRKDEKRWYIAIAANGVTRTKLYSRFKMEQKLGRELGSDETVDHIDGDKTNDNIENLQILGRVEHAKKDAKRALPVEIVCVLCGAKALKKGSYLRGSAKKGRAGPFCTKSCAGKYGQRVQADKSHKLPAQPTVTVTYVSSASMQMEQRLDSKSKGAKST